MDATARAAADALAARRRALASAAETSGAGTDPAYAPDRERFGAYTHAEIWEHVHERLDPGALGATAAAWQAGADAVGEAFQTFADTTAREFARWSGESASAAERATRTFLGVGARAQDVCRAVQRLMELNRDAAQTVRAAIPPPRHYVPLDDPAAEAVFGGRRRLDHDLAAAAEQADAADAMTYLYSPTMPATGDNVPRFPTVDGPASGGSGAR